MPSIFRAWIRYFVFSLRSIFVRRCLPTYVSDGEEIAREIFSRSCYKADGSVRPNAFGLNRRNDSALSVNRSTLAPAGFFCALGLKHAKSRGPTTTYYGSANLSANSIRSTVLDDFWSPNVLGSPTKENPFHADIPYPPDRGRDYDLALQVKLARCAIFKANDVDC